MRAQFSLIITIFAVVSAPAFAAEHSAEHQTSELVSNLERHAAVDPRVAQSEAPVKIDGGGCGGAPVSWVDDSAQTAVFAE